MKLNHYMSFLRVAIDGREEGCISGRVYSQRLKEPFPFRDTTGLLLEIEELLDKQDFPRAFQRKRTFAEQPRRKKPTENRSGSHAGASPDSDDGESPDERPFMDADMVKNAKGEVFTFDINIITRQNTSWQGYIDWLDGSGKVAYNSVLELLSMITERMEELGKST